MSLEAMVGSLSRDEKLALMELIWRDLTADSQSLASPKWHEAVLMDRLKNPADGRRLPLSEAMAEIEETIDARRASR